MRNRPIPLGRSIAHLQPRPPSVIVLTVVVFAVAFVVMVMTAAMSVMVVVIAVVVVIIVLVVLEVIVIPAVAGGARPLLERPFTRLLSRLLSLQDTLLCCVLSLLGSYSLLDNLLGWSCLGLRFQHRAIKLR